MRLYICYHILYMLSVLHALLSVAAEITAVTKNARYLVSGAADGCVSMWDMDTGTLMDTHALRGVDKVTALTFAGPMMVRAWVHACMRTTTWLPFISEPEGYSQSCSDIPHSYTVIWIYTLRLCANRSAL